MDFPIHQSVSDECERTEDPNNLEHHADNVRNLHLPLGVCDHFNNQRGAARINTFRVNYSHPMCASPEQTLKLF